MWTLFFFEAAEESVGTLAIMQTATKETRLLSLKFFIFLALVKVLGLRDLQGFGLGCQPSFLSLRLSALIIRHTEFRLRLPWNSSRKFCG